MALHGHLTCLKFLVFIANFLFWLCGLGVMAIGLWLLFDQQLYLQSIGAEQSDYITGTYIILGIGMVMTLVGFLGCCGSWKESPWMLGTFFIFLLVILIGEVAFGVVIYLRAAPYDEVVRKFVENTVVRKYHNNSTAVTQTFDMLQEKLECCGSDGPIDWSKAAFNNNGDTVPEIGIPKSGSADGFATGGKFDIPRSCCKAPNSAICASAVLRVDAEEIPYDHVHKAGCSGKLIEFLEDNIIYFIVVAGLVLVIQLIGLVFSLCLCCALKRIEDYKA